MNKNNEIRQLRICSHKGRYYFAFVEVDSDGDVMKILREDFDMSFKTLEELKEMLMDVNLASTRPIVHRNACTERTVMKEVF